NAIAAPIALSFTAPAWSRPPVGLGTASGAPVLVVSEAGAVVAAWTVGAAGARRVVVGRHDGAGWQPLGDALGAADASSPAIALGATGAPIAAWIEAGAARAARWDGAAWIDLPSPGAGTRVALATPASGGEPVAAVFGAGVAVRALSADHWLPLGNDLALGGTVVGDPSLASPAEGRAVVGWVEVAGGASRVRVYRYASSWIAMAAIDLGAPPSGIDRMSLAARDQTIAVAWDQWSGSFGVYAAQATGSATSWTRLGRALDVDVAGDATGPAIALDAAGAPIVAWREKIETTERGAIARWTGSAWAIVGGPSWLPDGSAGPAGAAIALHAGQAPVVGWIAGGALGVARFNGPRSAAVGLASRASIAGCRFSAASPPARLLQTGCFTMASPGKPVPHAGLVPYDVVAELWTDGAKKRRWIALPDGASMTTTSTDAWGAPAGAFLVKEFAVETTPGDPRTRRPVETRFLIRTATGWEGFTYRWQPGGGDADLLNDGVFTSSWPLDGGGTYTHVYPSRSQCLSCHEGSYGPLLGLRPQQLARWADYGGVIAEQLPTLAAIGVAPSASGTPWISPHDASASTAERTRGYLASNCAHCHNPDHIAIKDLRYTTPLAQTRLCEVIAPGAPAQSRVYQLVTSRPGMPALGSLVPDPLAAQLVGGWIASMGSCP
ncbi:MAG: hypothetical protein ACTHU0_31925, partial [Kofleriaceae bacterium]